MNEDIDIMNEDAKDGLYKKQTAVNYYRENILKITRLLVTGEITTDAWVLLETELIKQAKEMEKQQIIDAVNEGIKQGYTDYIDTEWGRDNEYSPEQYYIKTYGGNK